MKYYTLLVAMLSMFVVKAQANTIGPAIDYRAVISAPTPTITVPTHFTLNIPIPFDGIIHVEMTDRKTIQVNSPVAILAAAYVTITPTSPPGTIAPNLTITDVWARDLNPGGSTLRLAGFDPEVVPLSATSFMGHSGTIYTSFLDVTTTVGNLSTALPGFDFSAFEGDPDAVVYYSQTIVPVSDAVPESGEYVTFIAGLLMCVLGFKWRRYSIPA